MVISYYSKDFSSGLVQFSDTVMGTSLNPLLVAIQDTSPLLKLDRIIGLHNPPQHSQVGCHELRWKNFHMATLKANSTYSLEYWKSFIDPTMGWWPEITPFLTYSAKFGKKWITIQETLKSPIPDKWRSATPPSISPKWRMIWQKDTA